MNTLRPIPFGRWRDLRLLDRGRQFVSAGIVFGREFAEFFLHVG